MEQQNTLMTVVELDRLVPQELKVSDFGCHLMPGEEHSAIIVGADEGQIYVYYRCQLKWWEAVVTVNPAAETANVTRVTKLASAWGSPASAAKKLASKSRVLGAR